MATPGVREIKLFWKKGHDIIIFVNGITNKILSRDSNYIVDVVTWPKKFANSSISMREVMKPQVYKDWPPEKLLFLRGLGWSSII